ncbi:hypothetical protein LCGC14_0942810 [marine sediment metagenome]|uniref:Uncharacterized protein n=1 Tax=marine sediment metagenome TaxID=412755 RepID=A0A0F9P5M4_9ZZZZ
MPRQARIILENTPHHIVQRGHNRQIVFGEKADYLSPRHITGMETRIGRQCIWILSDDESCTPYFKPE